MTESDLIFALRERYAPPEFAFLSQVRSRTGYRGAIRTADAMAMSLYPSRGLDLMGFEVKVSRSDWVREKKDPDKAEEIARYCDRWWVVVADESIVQPGELPPNWGLLAMKGSKLAVKVEAPKLEPKPVSRDFLASLFRNMQEELKAYVPRDEIRAELDKSYRLGEEAGRVDATRELNTFKRSYDVLKQSLDAFEKASGIRITPYDGKRLGDAVALVLHFDIERLRLELEAMSARARAIANDIDRHLERAS